MDKTTPNTWSFTNQPFDFVEKFAKIYHEWTKKALHGESNEYMGYKSSYTSMAQVRGLIGI